MNENKYNPSEEEMKNAEEMMGPKKAELSALREKGAQLLKEMGMDGYLEISYDGSEWHTISGRINGHSIILKINTVENNKGWKGEWQGEVDGFKLWPEESKKLVEKYRDVWESNVLRKENLEAAQKEEVAPGRAWVLKDIGL